MKEFNEGVFYAAALMVTFLDQPTYAADILEQAGLANSDVTGLDVTEQIAMSSLMLQEPNRVNLTGFTVEIFKKGDPCTGCKKEEQSGLFCDDCVPL